MTGTDRRSDGKMKRGFILKVAVSIIIALAPFFTIHNIYHRTVVVAMVTPVVILFWAMEADLIDCRKM